jgi:CMP-N-acetylneuraminic acid synthetase
LLQPTQPLRQPKHLRAALDLLAASGADSVVSVVELPLSYSPDVICAIWRERLRPYPVYVSHEQRMEFSEQPTRRQDAEVVYRRDGTCYAFRRRTVEHYGNIYGDFVKPLIIPADESCELDSLADWAALERRIAPPTRD